MNLLSIRRQNAFCASIEGLCAINYFHKSTLAVQNRRKVANFWSDFLKMKLLVGEKKWTEVWLEEFRDRKQRREKDREATLRTPPKYQALRIPEPALSAWHLERLRQKCLAPWAAKGSGTFAGLQGGYQGPIFDKYPPKIANLEVYRREKRLKAVIWGKRTWEKTKKRLNLRNAPQCQSRSRHNPAPKGPALAGSRHFGRRDP